MSIPVVIASGRHPTENPDLRLCLLSIDLYAPDWIPYVFTLGLASEWPRWLEHTWVSSQFATWHTFGQAYNGAISRTFSENKDTRGIVVANDDIIIHPTTAELLAEDIHKLSKSDFDKLGWVASRFTYGRDVQRAFGPSTTTHRSSVISPVCAYISREAWEATKGFPPLNWFSDDIHCYDLEAIGYRNYMSRAFVYHSGERTTGSDHNSLYAESMDWIRLHRPDYIKYLENRNK